MIPPRHILVDCQHPNNSIFLNIVFPSHFTFYLLNSNHDLNDLKIFKKRFSFMCGQVLDDGSLVVTEGEGKQELLIGGVLNIGVRPDVAIRRARAAFERAGRTDLSAPEASSSSERAKEANPKTSAKAVKTAKESRSAKKNAASPSSSSSSSSAAASSSEEVRGRNLVLERAGISGIDVFEDAALVKCSINGSKRDLRTRLVLDWFVSPIGSVITCLRFVLFWGANFFNLALFLTCHFFVVSAMFVFVLFMLNSPFKEGPP